MLGMGAVLAATQELGFSRSVTPGLVQRYAAKFGPESRTRIAGWQAFVRSTAAAPRPSANELELLAAVNTFFNGIPFIDDLKHWRVEDYWATPAEAFASDGADCEDFSIAKYFALKELGVPIQRLRITYVKAVRLNQAHMVLAYYPEPDAVPLILDNLEDSVRPASERDDLIPVYSFNDEDVLIVRQGQRDARAGSSLQIRLWRALLEKLEQELHY
ncbi:MAG: transglutaminase-like cysteine peptidase [Burkholderiales bacterium]|nr:transglutaminase-like cysteine peptidase [Burkholderiales bacterium]